MPEYRTTPQKIEDNQLYRYYRNQWLLAGTDNFTAPPAQNQDMFEQLINILPPATNTLGRRWGYRNFFHQVDSGGIDGDVNLLFAPPQTPLATIKARNLYSYENHTLNARTIIGTSGDGTGANSLTNNVVYWPFQSATGLPTSIFTPALNATSPRAVNARDYEYFVDGIQGDQKAWNLATGVSKWGITAPTSGVGLAATSGTSAPWTANTVFSTMGILVDLNGKIEQLVSINAKGTNSSTTLGTTGFGQPTWNQTSGGTTTDGPVTWFNNGPIGLWQPNHFFNPRPGTLTNPAVIYDPITKALYHQQQGGGGTSGSTYPNFVPANGTGANDGSNKWEFDGFVQTATKSGLTTWQPNHFYLTFGATNDFSNSVVVEPMNVADAYDPITNTFKQTLYLQGAQTGGTTPASTTQFFTDVTGTFTDDNQLRWLNLGSATWPANTAVIAWAPKATNFSAIKDSNGNIQVCIASGTTAGSAPTWATAYGSTTNETTGTAVWTNVGTSLSWASNTQWFLPTNGFVAPQTSTSFGGASVVDSNTNLETVLNSGK